LSFNFRTGIRIPRCFELFLIVANRIWKKTAGPEHSPLISRSYKESTGSALFCFVTDVAHFPFRLYATIGGLCAGEMGFVAEHVAPYPAHIQGNGQRARQSKTD